MTELSTLHRPRDETSAARPSDARVSTRLSVWLPLTLGCAILLAGIVVWRLLVPLENDRVRLQTEKTGISVVAALNGTSRAQLNTSLRQAERLSRADMTETDFRDDSARYFRDFPGILILRRSMSGEPSLLAVRDGISPEPLLAAKSDLRGAASPTNVDGFSQSLSPPVVVDGTLVYFLDFYCTTADGREFALTTVLDGKKWLGEALDLQPNFNALLMDGDSVVYARDDGHSDSRWTERFAVAAAGRTWSVAVTPKPEIVKAAISHLPAIVLGGAILLALALVVASYLAIIARERRVLVAAAAQELEFQTERQRDAEKARDAAHRELGSILESITDGFVIVDKDWRYTYVNNVAAVQAGIASNQLLGRSIWEVFPHFATSPDAVHLHRAMQERVPVNVDRHANDKHFYALRAYPHLDGVALYFHDVTEQHSIADKLGKSEGLLRQAQSIANIGSFVRDLSGNTEEWSDELFNLLGIEPEQMGSGDQQFLRFVHEDDRSRVAEAKAELRQNGGETELKIRMVTANGDTRTAALRMRIDQDASGKGQSIAGTIQDVTERRRAESELAVALTQSRQQSAKFRALNRAMLLVSAKLGHPDLHQVLVEELRETVRAHIGVLQLATDEGAQPYASFSDKYAQWPHAISTINSLRLLAESGRSEKAMRMSQNELQANPIWSALNALPPSHAPLRGVLSVPLRDRNGKLLGFLQACDRIDDEFSADDEAVAVQFAQIASVAIGWARLIDDLRSTQIDLSQQLDEVDRSRQLLAEAEQVAKLGSWQIEPDVRGFITVSDEAARVFDVEGRRTTEIALLVSRVQGDDGEKLRALHLSLLRGEAADFDHEVRFRTSTGLKWLHIKAHATGKEKNRRIIGSVQDVTRQRESADRDRLSAQAFAGIAAGIPLSDSLNNIIALYESRFPDGLCSILLVDAENHLRTGAAPRLPDAYNQAIDGLSTGPKMGSCGTAAWRGERVIVTDTQSDPLWADFAGLAREYKLFACWSTPIFDASRRVLGTFAVYYDQPREPNAQELESVDRAAAVAAVAILSQRSRQQIEDREQRFHSLFTYVPEAVFALDMQGTIVDCNDAAVRMTGYRRDELVRNSIAMTVAPHLRPRLMEHIALAALGTPQQIELQRQRPDGSRYVTLSTKTPIVVDGKIVGIFSIVRDVTLERSNHIALEDALRTVKGNNRELEEFAFVASHDLQEPLRKVRAFGDRLRMHLGEQADKESVDYIERMRTAAERMQRLIDDLLAYSRIGKRERSTQLVDLHEVLNGVLTDMETSIEQKNAQIVCDTLPKVEADETQMRQLLQNLISNALKFSNGGRAPKITIHGETFRVNSGFDRRPWVRIVVSDNGIGFDNKYADRIFAAFQRLHGRGEYAGSGIGLAIVRRIVERHGGHIQAKGVVGEGAAFTIEIPQSGPDLITINPVAEKQEARVS